MHNPFENKIGFSQQVSKNAAISLQISSAKEKAENIKRVQSPINNWIESTNSLKISYIRYSNSPSLKSVDKLSFRSGFKFSDYNLNQSNLNIREFGITMGIGFKFKIVGNQLDINYYFGNREYSSLNEKESVHQVQFGVSLADIWFVKRRQK